MSSPAPTPGQPSLLNQILPYAVQGGLGLLGNKLAQGPTNQMNAWQRQQYEDALRRRNALQGLALPSMIRALGYSEDKSRGMAANYSNGTGQPSESYNSGPQTGGGPGALSKVSNVAGLGATGLGIASKLGAFGAAAAPSAASIGLATGAPLAAGSTAGALGLGTANAGMMLGGGTTAATGGGLGSTIAGLATNPWTIGAAGVLGAGLLAKHFVGEGRKAANKFVGSTENEFGGQLKQISQMATANPEAAKQQLQQAEAAYRQSAQSAMAQGGNEAKVAQQSLNNPKLWQTVAALKQQLGVA